MKHLLIAFALCSAAAFADVRSSSVVPEALKDVRIEQKLNGLVPVRDLRFKDEAGHEVRLGDYFGEKPVILALVYYECPMLCNLTLNGLYRAMKAMPLEIGRDYEVVTVSFDPRETPALAAAKKKEYVSKLRKPQAAAGWRFLVGEETQVQALAEAVGFRYRWDDKARQFVHASGLMVLTPEGRLSRYFYGVEFSARDLRLGLVEASEGKIGSAVEQILLYCYHYDPTSGKYSVAINNVIRASGAATVVALVSFWFVMFRRERQRKHLDDVERSPVIS